jgi:hypothetical protein
MGTPSSEDQDAVGLPALARQVAQTATVHATHLGWLRLAPPQIGLAQGNRYSSR